MRKILLISLVCLGVFLCWQSQIYRLKSTLKISPPLKKELIRLAESGLAQREVPVGAIILWRDSIVGRGFNTVVVDTMVTAHAEINALNEAHKRLKPIWPAIDKSELTLYTTYEPCALCKGAMVQFGVENMVFEKSKPWLEQVKITLKNTRFECRKRRMDAPDLQDSLFRAHPDFPQRTPKLNF